jgi:pyridoxine/pyridoxamine 5'-phosphate oxidase
MATLDRDRLLGFMRQERYAVQASVSPTGRPQAAVVGIVVSDRFEVFFDTLMTTRKAENLRHNPAVAMVIGPISDGAERTVQLEGVADEPAGTNLRRLLDLYFDRFPDGRDRQAWAGITYMRVTPMWLRYSDYSADPPLIVEMSDSDLRLR